MQLTITNQTAAPVFINSLYTSVPVATPLVVERSFGQMTAMADLQTEVTAGTVTVAIAASADETGSGLVVPGGATIPYTPAVSGDWTGADPTELAAAVDRIAAALGPIA